MGERETRKTRWPWLLLASLLSGGLLFLTDYPVHLWPLQLVALVPWLVALRRWAAGRWAALASGAAFGAAYSAPLLVALDFPLSFALALGAYLGGLWVLLALALHHVNRWSPVWSALGAGAAAVLVEWIDVSLVPVWGTAQCFVRVCSAAPPAIQLVSLTGMLGLVFVLVTFQSLLAQLLVPVDRSRAHTPRLLVATAVLVATVGAVNLALWSAGPAHTVRVAAVGWTSQQLHDSGLAAAELTVAEVIVPHATAAAAAGARLVVTPETGFWLSPRNRDEVLASLAAAARRLELWLAVGFFDDATNTNRIAFFSPDGSDHGEYRKTHLITGIENYTPGDGSLVLLPFPDARMGGMICQDDNFTDLSRRYGQEGVRLMAVPTNDWEQVRRYHLENSRFRGVESGYAIVRAASNGISAIVTARGEVLAERDHFAEGIGRIEADLPIYERGSLYNRIGDWGALGLAVVLIGAGAVLARRRNRAAA